jgi:hypothetical protein
MKQNKKKEFSKKLCKFSLAIFTIVTVLGILLCFSERATDFFAYAIPSTGALAAASIAFYFNKAKAENLSKYLKFELTADNVWMYKMYVQKITFYVYCNENYYLYNGGKKEAKLLWISSPPYF